MVSGFTGPSPSLRWAATAPCPSLPAQRDSKAKNSLGTASQPSPGSKIHSPSKLCEEALLRQALWEAAGVGEWKAQGAREAMTQIGGLGKVDH